MKQRGTARRRLCRRLRAVRPSGTAQPIPRRPRAPDIPAGHGIFGAQDTILRSPPARPRRPPPRRYARLAAGMAARNSSAMCAVLSGQTKKSHPAAASFLASSMKKSRSCSLSPAPRREHQRHRTAGHGDLGMHMRPQPLHAFEAAVRKQSVAPSKLCARMPMVFHSTVTLFASCAADRRRCLGHRDMIGEQLHGTA